MELVIQERVPAVDGWVPASAPGATPAQLRAVQSLIDIQQDPFVLIGPDYRIVAANRAYCQHYGLDAENVVGQRCHEVSHLSAVPCHLNGEDCPHQRVFETGLAHEVVHIHFDCHRRKEFVRIKGHPIVGADGTRYLGEAITRIAGSEALDCRDMIGSSPAFLDCLDRLTRAAQCGATVLLLGESGVGKELAAQHIHRHSARRDKPFVALNCATIPEHLFEDEIFGHERGAFTGCIGRKPGLFELADGGILFLDEIGEMPLPAQAKLLRVLESGEFRRLGGVEVQRADVRLILATNRDLSEMAQAGSFRADLFYRIAAIDVQLPSLRERRSDIPALAEQILGRLAKAGMADCRLSGEALAKLMAYSFPGNVRELKNLLIKALAGCSGGVIDAEQIVLGRVGPGSRSDDDALLRQRGPHQDLGNGSGVPTSVPVLKTPASPARFGAGANDRVWDAGSLAQHEAARIKACLDHHGGHRRRTADALGISERSLYRKLTRYGLREPSAS